MYAYHRFERLPFLSSSVVRWCARASALVLVTAWVAYAIAELFNAGLNMQPQLAGQGASLAIVFLGYAIAWKHEIAGGVLAMLGVVIFVIVYTATIGVFPQAPIAWFAVPGLLFIAASRLQRRETRLAISWEV
jgi:hypothetical protein